MIQLRTDDELEHYGRFLLIIIQMGLTMSAYGFFAGTVAASPELASALVPAWVIPLVMGGGFIANVGQLKG